MTKPRLSTNFLDSPRTYYITFTSDTDTFNRNIMVFYINGIQHKIVQLINRTLSPSLVKIVPTQSLINCLCNMLSTFYFHLLQVLQGKIIFKRIIKGNTFCMSFATIFVGVLPFSILGIKFSHLRHFFLNCEHINICITSKLYKTILCVFIYVFIIVLCHAP